MKKYHVNRDSIVSEITSDIEKTPFFVYVYIAREPIRPKYLFFPLVILT